MACYDSCKTVEEDSYEDDGAGELSECALAMLEKERESLLSPSEGPGTLLGSSSSLPTPAPQQGYDVEFDPPLESKYECPICLMALRNAVQTPCGHRFCKNCIEKSIRDTGQKCPVDNEMLSEDQLFPDNFAKREILSLTVRCPYPGCSHKMELRTLENHLSVCEFSTLPCPHCQRAVRKSFVEQHIEEECPRRPVLMDCAVTKVVSQVHEQQCPFASVTCQYCDMDLVRDQMESHCDTECPKAPIACNFSIFGCKERMLRHDLAQHMQEFTQMHMRYMAEFLRGLSVNGTRTRAPRLQCSSASMQRLREMDARLVKQDHQLRELIILKETQTGQLAELRRRVSMLEETVKELDAQQCHGVFIWKLRNFSALLKTQEAGQPVVEHSPGFYTGRPGYKLCLRLHLQTPNAPRCSNYISLFVHTMQGTFDSQLSWPFHGIIRLAILDQGPESQHHMEMMETKPDLQAFQKPTIQRNPKGFGYVTFMHLHQLHQRAFIRDDTLLIRCEVTPRFDIGHREGPAVQSRGPEAPAARD
uniref:TNF receptor-associated factor n=1 Tax=Periophthalmus magnuspinnatus TaxID=409849 RepID=A0A3B4AEN3_9GOBI